MSTQIFYFSGTGNSLYVAQTIKAEIDNVELVSIPKVLNKLDTIAADKVGFVFPVYAWGLPRIVEDFAKSIKVIGTEYTFAIATCGGTPGGTLIELQKLLQKEGTTLDAGFAVKTGNYTFLSENIFMKIMPKIAGAPPATFKKRLSEIIQTINNNQQYPLETSSKLANLIGTSIHKMAIGQFKNSATNFWVTQACTSCGSCVKLCPRDNIELVDNQPNWKQDCEACFGCIQWCPQKAIEYQDLSQGQPRSHHSEISLEDMIN